MRGVVIRGGGIAGQVLRRELALKGIFCRLEDRAIFPRDKVCGGVLQYDSWEYLNSIFTLRTPVRKIHTLVHFLGWRKISSMRLRQEMVYAPRLVLDEDLNSQNQTRFPDKKEKMFRTHKI